jgi:hypothetical protein
VAAKIMCADTVGTSKVQINNEIMIRNSVLTKLLYISAHNPVAWQLIGEIIFIQRKF